MIKLYLHYPNPPPTHLPNNNSPPSLSLPPYPPQFEHHTSQNAIFDLSLCRTRPHNNNKKRRKTLSKLRQHRARGFRTVTNYFAACSPSNAMVWVRNRVRNLAQHPINTLTQMRVAEDAAAHQYSFGGAKVFPKFSTTNRRKFDFMVWLDWRTLIEGYRWV